MRWLFVPVLQGKKWDGETVDKEPLGGSEAAVAYIARELATRGQQVFVISTGVESFTPFFYKGAMVMYVPPWGFDTVQKQPWDVVVSSRDPSVFQFAWGNAKKILWLHDMPNGQQMTGMDHVVFVSEYQRSVWGGSPTWSSVIYNGIDPDYFHPATDEPDDEFALRDSNKLLWISNPDRGLPYTARIFQDIRRRWPDLELHVYGRSAVYGWDASVEMAYIPLPQHSENVFMHEPLSRPELANELRKARAVFYPTYWPETFCISALEAQACGTPVIASPLAALNETVLGGVLSWDYLNAISQVRNKGRWVKLSEMGVEYASDKSWNLHAQQWLHVAGQLGAK